MVRIGLVQNPGFSLYTPGTSCPRCCIRVRGLLVTAHISVISSVIWSSEMLKEEFTNNGFAVLEDVFSEAEITGVSDEVDRVIDGRASYIPERDLVYEPDIEPRRVRNAFRLHIYHQTF